MTPICAATASRLDNRAVKAKPRILAIVARAENGPPVARYPKARTRAAPFGTLRIDAVVALDLLEQRLPQLPSSRASSPDLTSKPYPVSCTFTKSSRGVEVDQGYYGVVGVEPHTVDTHRGNLMQKLNVHSIPELILYAMRKGIIR